MKYVIIRAGLDSDIKSVPDDSEAEHAFDVLGHAKMALSGELRHTRNRYNDTIRRIEAINNRTIKPLHPSSDDEPVAA